VMLPALMGLKGLQPQRNAQQCLLGELSQSSVVGAVWFPHGTLVHDITSLHHQFRFVDSSTGAASCNNAAAGATSTLLAHVRLHH
jgi:hypothetical protein